MFHKQYIKFLNLQLKTKPDIVVLNDLWLFIQ